MSYDPQTTLSLKIVLLSLFAFSAIVPFLLINDLIRNLNLSNENYAYTFYLLYGGYFIGLLMYISKKPDSK